MLKVQACPVERKIMLVRKRMEDKVFDKEGSVLSDHLPCLEYLEAEALLKLEG